MIIKSLKKGLFFCSKNYQKILLLLGQNDFFLHLRKTSSKLDISTAEEGSKKVIYCTIPKGRDINNN